VRSNRSTCAALREAFCGLMSLHPLFVVATSRQRRPARFPRRDPQMRGHARLAGGSVAVLWPLGHAYWRERRQ
jgi:hypothetical protein